MAGRRGTLVRPSSIPRDRDFVLRASTLSTSHPSLDTREAIGSLLCESDFMGPVHACSHRLGAAQEGNREILGCPSEKRENDKTMNKK